MALYGLSVCPLLNLAGFRFGCAYAGTFVALVSVINFSLIKIFRRQHGLARLYYPQLVPLFSYLVATCLTLISLQYLYKLNHLSGTSRAPEILLLASFLMGLTQYYGLEWAYAKDRTEDRLGAESLASKAIWKWIFQISKTLLPAFVSLIVLIHFALSQSAEFNNGRVAPGIGTESLIKGTTYLISFLAIWLTTTYFFYFASEWDQLSLFQVRMDRLKVFNFAPVSEAPKTFGLWEIINDSISNLSSILKQKNQLLKNFSKVVSQEVAAQALDQELLIRPTIQQNLTVFMVDIRNFTSLSETMAPEKTVQWLNLYFQHLLDVFSQHSIVIDKFIGDGVLAYVETSNEESHLAEVQENIQGVQASLNLLGSLKKLNQELRQQDFPEIKLGIGIYRGSLIKGFIGGTNKIQHTIIGDTVNRAARLESLCKEKNTSMVTSSWVFYSLPESLQAHFEDRGEVSLKGVTEKMTIFGLRNESLT